MRVFFGKNIEKKHLCHHGKNHCHFCKSNITVINLIDYSFAVWNLIQNVLLTLKPNIYCSCLNICAIFAYPSNKRVINEPQRNP